MKRESTELLICCVKMKIDNNIISNEIITTQFKYIILFSLNLVPQFKFILFLYIIVSILHAYITQPSFSIEF